MIGVLESDMDRTAIALNRFGLGARADDRIAGDPAQWLKVQMRSYRPGLPDGHGLATRAQVVGAIRDYRMAQQQRRQGRRENGDQATDSRTVAPKPAQQFRRDARQDYEAQIGIRTRTAVESDAPFVEALVHFWANHFAVSVDKQVMIALAGLMEFEAIRPHVLGRFEDMLVAVEQHPAMLLYLDQVQSIGPNSPAGQRAAQRGNKRGLNENLGREILELHTLGVRAGYDQADVTEFARALTGWSVAGLGPAGRRAEREEIAPGDFIFAVNQHEPGTRTIMGKTYMEGGAGQARAVLSDLARHPATARHIATKLARHFVADDPPPALVARLEQAYRSSDGDLPTIYTALIDAPESWNAVPAKFRTPWEWSVAAMRAMGSVPLAEQDAAMANKRLAGMFAQLGQPVWKAGSPAGYDDIAASWAGADALVRRVEVAQRFAARTPPSTDPRALTQALFPGGVSPLTEQVIARAEGPQQGMALLLVSPEMLRR